MSLTQSEILASLNITGSPARAVVELTSRELSPTLLRAIYVQFAGDNGPTVSDTLLAPTVSYLVHDAAAGLPLNVQGAIDKATALTAANPWRFSEAAERERLALVAAEKPKAAKPPAPRDDDDDEDGGAPVVNRDGVQTFKRGRPAPGTKTAYAQAAELLAEAVNHTREAGIALLQEKLGLGFGSAQTYYYKAKKERNSLLSA